ncbi:DUF721 domain-containing protein [Flavobacterium zepuense]|uniref:DUF721 domain-containing protein n=1 Tax=Flavobacterium zepuense TaxID=2593302 RepID=A0A552V309_9FLAO|nr:DUF721 domain-containing protein [Flavobacterium zepuense]TRW24827.1 DUF721 domain-containing protein [Flavobacterium zepuense]
MAKRLNDNNSLSDVLKHIMESNNLQKGLDKIDVREAWKNLMGNGVNNYTREIMLKNGTLYVELTSAVLREELSYGREKIVKMINEDLGREVVTTVVLR